MIPKVIGLIILVTYIGTSFVVAGTWGEWRAISICTAKPCNCTGKMEDENDCKSDGKITEIRSCSVDKDGWTCKYSEKKLGAIRTRPCNNLNVCPGWSDEIEEGPCVCPNSNSTEGEVKIVRYCNNPPPIHAKVLCQNPTTDDKGFKMDSSRPCNCSKEEQEMETTTEKGTTTLLPCCSPDETTTSSYNNETYDTDDIYNQMNNSNASNSSGSNDLDSHDNAGGDTEESTASPGNKWDDYYEDIDDSQPDQVTCVPCPIVTEDATQPMDDVTQTTPDPSDDLTI